MSASVVGFRVTGPLSESTQFAEVVQDAAIPVSVVRGVFVPDPSGTNLAAADESSQSEDADLAV